MTGGFFLEKIFGYAVYDFLVDKEENKEDIKYSNSEKFALEKITEELWLLDGNERRVCRLFLLELIEGRHRKLMKSLDLYLLAYCQDF